MLSAERKALRGPMLAPRDGGTVDYIPDALLRWNADGVFTYVGEAAGQADADTAPLSLGLILPPLLDNHIHIPQHPIRGKFCDGIGQNEPNGRLLAGLNRNVFPTESRCSDPGYTRDVVDAFLQDTLSKGVVGGAAYMTVHAGAVRIALERLPATWHVGLVLMNQNCPEYLRTDEANLDRDIESLARDFGRRVIVTDRFAVAVTTPLRRRAMALAETFNLRSQTHLNEQPAEKRFIEQTLYPGYASYTDVYAKDGLLAHDAILAHCIHMRPAEWDTVAASGSNIAHCPTSNTLLGSGIMPLDEVLDREIPYAICTDVGASPTTSILAEMAQFLTVHAGRSKRASPMEALYRTTLGAAKMLALDAQLGRLEAGRPASFIEAGTSPMNHVTVEEAIATHLLAMNETKHPANEEPAFNALAKGGVESPEVLTTLSEDFARTADRLNTRVHRTTLNGKTVFAGTITS